MLQQRSFVGELKVCIRARWNMAAYFSSDTSTSVNGCTHMFAGLVGPKKIWLDQASWNLALISYLYQSWHGGCNSDLPNKDHPDKFHTCYVHTPDSVWLTSVTSLTYYYLDDDGHYCALLAVHTLQIYPINLQTQNFNSLTIPPHAEQLSVRRHGQVLES